MQSKIKKKNTTTGREEEKEESKPAASTYDKNRNTEGLKQNKVHMRSLEEAGEE